MIPDLHKEARRGALRISGMYGSFAGPAGTLFPPDRGAAEQPHTFLYYKGKLPVSMAGSG